MGTSRALRHCSLPVHDPPALSLTLFPCSGLCCHRVSNANIYELFGAPFLITWSVTGQDTMQPPAPPPLPRASPPPPPPPPSPPPPQVVTSGSDAAVIAGAVGGAAAFALICVAAAWYVIRRRRRAALEQEEKYKASEKEKALEDAGKNGSLLHHAGSGGGAGMLGGAGSGPPQRSSSGSKRQGALDVLHETDDEGISHSLEAPIGADGGGGGSSQTGLSGSGQGSVPVSAPSPSTPTPGPLGFRPPMAHSGPAPTLAGPHAADGFAPPLVSPWGAALAAAALGLESAAQPSRVPSAQPPQTPSNSAPIAPGLSRGVVPPSSSASAKPSGSYQLSSGGNAPGSNPGTSSSGNGPFSPNNGVPLVSELLLPYQHQHAWYQPPNTSMVGGGVTAGSAGPSPFAAPFADMSQGLGLGGMQAALSGEAASGNPHAVSNGGSNSLAGTRQAERARQMSGGAASHLLPSLSLSPSLALSPLPFFSQLASSTLSHAICIAPPLASLPSRSWHSHCRQPSERVDRHPRRHPEGGPTRLGRPLAAPDGRHVHTAPKQLRGGGSGSGGRRALDRRGGDKGTGRCASLTLRGPPAHPPSSADMNEEAGKVAVDD